MVKRWLNPSPVKVPHAIRDLVGGHPLVSETLVRRGLRTVPEIQAFLDPQYYEPAPAADLPGLPKAIERILHAVDAGELICVWGDFDVDGQTSTTVLVTVLQDLGADVIYHIPVRATESHGVKVPWLQQELSKGVKLVVTCDTGIDAHDAAMYAKDSGVDMIITDHHELPPALPDAYAIVNPHLLPDRHPLSTLPGVGVAYKLAEALYERTGQPDAAERLLDLVALGIVADVAVLKGDARYLLQRGLERLRHTPRLGLQELLKLAEVLPSGLDEEDVGFSIAPRLNALGRLDDANVVVEFLTTEDVTRARILASQLEALNARRKDLCDQVFAEAEKYIRQDPTLLESPVLVLEDPQWLGGVLGIVANRLVERYHRPAILLSTPAGAIARGSARSIAGCHITEALATQTHLLESFGGHEMAAGLSIHPARIPELRQGLAKTLAETMDVERAEPTLETHGELALSELSLHLVSDLQRLAPFGPGNPPLILVARDVTVKAQRQLGRSGKHLRVTVEDREHVERNVVWWNWDGATVPEGRFDLAFSVRINAFRGDVDVQIVWEDGRLTAAAMEAAARATRALEILDYRSNEAPEAVLRQLLANGADMTVWAEGSDLQKMAELQHPMLRPQHRLRLRPAETLVIWSPPPGPEVLRRAVDLVDPTRVVLFTGDAELDSAPAFLMYLVGLIKHAFKKSGGRVSVPELAAVMGQQELAVRLGLAWLEAKDYVRVVDEGGLLVQLEPGDAGREVTDPTLVQRLSRDVAAVLAETGAYRAFYGRAGGDDILKVVPQRERTEVTQAQAQT